MQSLLQDVRYGWRLMWRNPGFTLAAVATLALGIGANAAIFSILNVLSLKPLPYHDPARVAFVLGWDLEEGEARFNLAQADFVDLQRQATSLEGWQPTLSQRQPHRWRHARAGAGVPSHAEHVLAAWRGGSDRPGFDEAGRADVAVISHGLWQRRFGGDRSIVGRRVVMNGQPCRATASLRCAPPSARAACGSASRSCSRRSACMEVIAYGVKQQAREFGCGPRSARVRATCSGSSLVAGSGW